MYFIWGVIFIGFIEFLVIKFNIMYCEGFESVVFEDVVEKFLGVMILIIW